jgi:hypothetical protein
MKQIVLNNIEDLNFVVSYIDANFGLPVPETRSDLRRGSRTRATLFDILAVHAVAFDKHKMANRYRIRINKLIEEKYFMFLSDFVLFNLELPPAATGSIPWERIADLPVARFGSVNSSANK